MKQLRIHWPWATVKKGQGFFIPCLDPNAVAKQGMRKAMEVRRFDAHYSIGIRNGLIGVWFFRRPSGFVPRTQSVVPSGYQSPRASLQE